MILRKDENFVPAPFTPVPYPDPVLPGDAPDPFVTYDAEHGYYYALYTECSRISILRAKTLSGLASGERLVIFRAIPEENGIYGDLWAPEMHRIGDRWYVYSSGRTIPRPEGVVWVGGYRLITFASRTSDPFDGFDYCGIADKEHQAIDPTVTRAPDGRLLLCHVIHGLGDGLFLRELTAPTVLSDEIVHLCSPDSVGEGRVNEGAFFVKSPNGRIFIVYSAFGCFDDRYRLSVMEYTGGAFDSSESWQKDDEPLLTSFDGLYGPGHASFFTAEDGRLYVAFHAMHPGAHGTGNPVPRYLHIRPVVFDGTGYPHIIR